MTRGDLAIIRKLAKSYDTPNNGERAELKEKAIAVYRKYLPLMTERERSQSISMKFMGEVDHVLPDPVLREHYRKQLLAS